MNYNPYFGTNMMPQQNPYLNQFYGNQPIQQPQPVKPQPTEVQMPFKTISLQGKTVDSVDVVKAMDIPLDGSVSYFPIIDGSAIVTKQLLQDGTSKTTIYKPVNEEEQIKEMPVFITVDEFNEKIKTLKNDDFKDDLKSIKRQIKDLQEDMEDINKDLKKRKD
jgi:hypothetical protein